MKRFAYTLCIAVLIIAFAGCGLNKKKNIPNNENSNVVETQNEISEEATVQYEESIQEESEEQSSANSIIENKPKPQLVDWKKAYLDYIEQIKNEHFEYALVYIDADDIPELYVSGDCEATGDGVCSYKGGRLIEQRLNRIGGGSYIHKSGLVFNFNGNMGYYTANVYKLTNNGFQNIFYGLQQERIIDIGNDQYDIEYDFFVGENNVTEEEFNNAIDTVFNREKSKDLHSQAVSYSKIKEQIINS